jgi:AcrR family transcriptional regulator
MGIIERSQKLNNVKKTDIIDGMEKALLSKSYDRLTIDDVAKEAEYSKKTIYSYFKSKNEIYLELLIRKFNLLYDALKNAIDGSGKTGIEKMRVIGKAYYRFANEFPEYMQAIITNVVKIAAG